MLPATSVNKDVAGIKPSPSAAEGRELRIETGCLPSRSALNTPPQKLRMKKHRILAPDSGGAYQRKDFNELELLHLPIHRKALNSST